MTQLLIDGVGYGVPRMLYASDGSNWYALKIRDSGILEVCSKDGDKIFGFESVVNNANSFTLASGTTIATSGAVPTGKVWVITAISVTNNTRAATSFYGGVLTGSTYVYLLADPDGTTIWNQSPFICQIYLKAGDKIFFYIGGGQNGDGIRIDYSGYQMNAP